MRGEGIDDGTLDRLLRGRILPDDAPPGYSDVASILAAAASRPTLDELRLESQHVAAARDAVRRRAHRRPGPLGLAMGSLLIVTLLLIPGLALAHALPDPAEHAVTTVLEKVGITIPPSTNHPTSPPSPMSRPAPSERPSAPAHPLNKGATVSSIATTTDATGVAKGAEISSVASDGKSQAGQHGEAAGAPHGKSAEAPHGPAPDVPRRNGNASADSGTHGPSGNGAAHASAKAAGGSEHP